MAKVTFKKTELVWFEIRGEDVSKPTDTLPSMPWDDGLVSRFSKWMLANDCYPIQSHYSGGGMWSGGFDPRSAIKVAKWLRKQGVVQI